MDRIIVKITAPEGVIELTETEWDTIRARLTLDWIDTTPGTKLNQVLDGVLAKFWGRD